MVLLSNQESGPVSIKSKVNLLSSRYNIKYAHENLYPELNFAGIELYCNSVEEG